MPDPTDGAASRPFRVLFVCTANQCRSALAQVIAETELRRWPDHTPLVFRSAGSHARAGSPATPTTVRVGAELGLDLARHRSRELTRRDVDAADLILVMSAEHFRYVFALDRDCADRTFLLASFARTVRGWAAPTVADLAKLALERDDPVPDDDVHDPVGGPEEDHRACARRLRLLVVPTVRALAGSTLGPPT